MILIILRPVSVSLQLLGGLFQNFQMPYKVVWMDCHMQTFTSPPQFGGGLSQKFIKPDDL